MNIAISVFLGTALGFVGGFLLQEIERFRSNKACRKNHIKLFLREMQFNLTGYKQTQKVLSLYEQAVEAKVVNPNNDYNCVFMSSSYQYQNMVNTGHIFSIMDHKDLVYLELTYRDIDYIQRAIGPSIMQITQSCINEHDCKLQIESHLLAMQTVRHCLQTAEKHCTFIEKYIKKIQGNFRFKLFDQ